ncbi:cytochrome c-type biogenesis protein CcmF [Novimethylophilus kurashikiensis]|uniref:Cytochrome c-type biogenesis protein CcmF n=1 Tax=Novimethylophilus kurashikiensis TaxID=1825523 RepID=A0A2R5F3R1_9PROT|nr:heme lyase CcmF/NrfE family subunit [Novimethylophilus kurashikiensis]GBG12925.1 cytochrome c-type biogenesis protein CcmF [Novimethylophilus kurashikiensis]
MIPELGHFALILALLLATTQAGFSLVGAARGNELWMTAGVSAARGQFFFIGIGFLSLAYAFYSNDFSVLYVASNSNSALPVQYRLAALWGGHEGSMLLWATTLALWTVAVTVFSRHLPPVFKARLLGTMGLISIGFLLFILLSSNPFERLIPAAMDGRDLNPLLQDPGMVFHPPVLYMGYVGFSVAFGFAIAALLGGELSPEWARWTRTWTTVAWMFLTVGIAFGSKWAYYELGWGGWWFWDAVENASFMPWLVGTALIHSLAVTEKRDAFKLWTVLLAIFAFSLSLLGTFLVRSGVLTSVHAFATDPRRGLFILGFLALVIGGALTLFALRAPKVGLGGKFGMVSRESMLLTNNVIMVVAAGVVMLGTLYPLFLDALGLGKISVGPPYFDTVFVPVMMPAIFLMGLAIFARWKNAALPDLMTRLKWAFGVSVVVALLLPFVMGKWTPMIALGLLMAMWIITTAVVSLRDRLQKREGGMIAALIHLPRAYQGMIVAHLGVAVFIIGVTMVKGYEVEQDMRMSPGDNATVGSYSFHFDGIQDQPGPNYMAAVGHFTATRNGREVAVLEPEKRMYTVQSMPMTEAAISAGLVNDLYVSLGEPVSEQAWAVRIYIKPFVQWIWVGALMMAGGGLLAMLDPRYRRRNKTQQGDNA